MSRIKRLAWALLGGCIVSGLGGCVPNPFFYSANAPVPYPVPPWVSERMVEKYDTRYRLRTPIMPPILPGQPAPTCDDPPSEDEVIRTMPPVVRGVPFIYEEFRDDFTVVIEKLVDRIDPCVYVPLLGPAQLHHCHYKCTVFYKERKQSDYPFPFQVENDRVQVVYIDKDHFHLCVGDNERDQRSVSKDLFGP